MSGPEFFALCQRVKRELEDSGYSGRVDAGAIKRLAEAVSENGGQLTAVQDVLRVCQAGESRAAGPQFRTRSWRSDLCAARPVWTGEPLAGPHRADGAVGNRKITREQVDAALGQLQGGAVQDAARIVVINAFDVPKISYDPVGRKMYADKDQRTIFGDAKVGPGSGGGAAAAPDARVDRPACARLA